MEGETAGAGSAAQHGGKEYTTLRRLKVEGDGGGWILELESRQPGVPAQGMVGLLGQRDP